MTGADKHGFIVSGYRSLVNHISFFSFSTFVPDAYCLRSVAYFSRYNKAMIARTILPLCNNQVALANLV